MRKFLEKLTLHGYLSGFPYRLFAAYQIINYLLDYPAWVWRSGSTDYPFSIFHVLSIVFCLTLLLKNYWPKSLQIFYTFYWYLVVTWCLPLANTIFYFQYEQYSSMLLLNFIIILFTLILIVDWLSFIVILVSGITLGIVYTLLTHTPIKFAHNELFDIATTFLWTIIIGVLFSQNATRLRKNLQLEKQLTSIKAVVASIAHELRTPLLSIRAGAVGIRKFIPQLIETYKVAAAAKLSIPMIYPKQFEHIERVMENIDSEVTYSNTVIDTLLTNANREVINPDVFDKHSVGSCIQAAIIRYPFNPKEQIQLVHFEKDEDFYFHGDDLLVIHIIFNLLKNAFYAIAEADKGEVYIRLVQENNQNLMYFRDTAKGLTSEARTKLFDMFYSKTPNNTGMGLAYCRLAMESFGGSISVDSKLGEYTEFILSFPLMKRPK